MKFEKTVGHKKQKELFAKAMENGHLSHAYALAGEENIGKTTFALDLAKILKADTVLDTFVFDAEAGFSVEQARELQRVFSLSSAGQHKVAVVCRAEALSSEAANCLLKILEEPPKNSLFIFTTSNFQALLPTLASRVQRINFSRLADEEVRLALKTDRVSPQRLEEIVELAAGRIGFAKSLASADGVFAFYLELAWYYQVFEIGTVAERLLAAEKVAALETPQIREFLKFAARVWVRKGAPAGLGKKLSAALRDMDFNLNSRLSLDNLFLV